MGRRHRRSDTNAINITICLDKTSLNWQYLSSCAKIRDISITALIKRIIDDTADGQLVTSILDDSDSLRTKRRGEHNYREL